MGGVNHIVRSITAARRRTLFWQVLHSFSRDPLCNIFFVLNFFVAPSAPHILKSLLHPGDGTVRVELCWTRYVFMYRQCQRLRT